MNIAKLTISIATVILLAACPDTEVATATDVFSTDSTFGDSSTSSPTTMVVGTTGAPDPTTGDDSTGTTTIGLDCHPVADISGDPSAVAAHCAAHPFERGPDCDDPNLPSCEEMLAQLAATPTCDEITICDYGECAAAMKNAECGARPPECAPITDCINAGPPKTGSCCDLNGAKGDDVCAVDNGDFCVDCEWRPTLCGAHVCGPTGDGECCLAPNGETVACDSLAPHIIDDLATCSIPEDMCATLEADCNDAGVDAESCLTFGQAVCPGSKCLACEGAVKACTEGGGDCSALASHCADSLTGCGCDAPTCHDVTELSQEQLFAVCFSWPLAIGQCDDPSVGECLTTIPWAGCKGLTTCDYEACMAAIEAGESCSAPPAECDKVVACVVSEATGG